MPRRRSAPPQRDGNPGGARYDNRTDLAMEGGSQPVRTPTGQPYGQAQALTEAQQAMPLPEAPAPPMAPPSAQRMPGTMTPVAAQGYRLPNLGLTQPSSATSVSSLRGSAETIRSGTGSAAARQNALCCVKWGINRTLTRLIP
jgi:hypothetical protein